MSRSGMALWCAVLCACASAPRRATDGRVLQRLAASERDRDGDRSVDSRDLCPDEPEDFDGYHDDDGCPDPDNDRDGILDTFDKCPNDPEDKDGFQDEDSCPDPDNDQDGIPDKLDKCPDEPEVYNGRQDDDGCPDSPGDYVRIDPSEVAVLFRSGDASVQPEAAAELGRLAGWMGQHPERLVVGIRGVVDPREQDQRPDGLGLRRAGSVAAWLVAHGVTRDRLVTIDGGVESGWERFFNQVPPGTGCYAMTSTVKYRELRSVAMVFKAGTTVLDPEENERAPKPYTTLSVMRLVLMARDRKLISMKVFGHATAKEARADRSLGLRRAQWVVAALLEQSVPDGIVAASGERVSEVADEIDGHGNRFVDVEAIYQLQPYPRKDGPPGRHHRASRAR